GPGSDACGATPVCGGKFTRVASFTPVTLVLATNLSNYKPVISSRHAGRTPAGPVTDRAGPDHGLAPPDRSDVGPELVVLLHVVAVVGVVLEVLDALRDGAVVAETALLQHQDA